MSLLSALIFEYDAVNIAAFLWANISLAFALSCRFHYIDIYHIYIGMPLSITFTCFQFQLYYWLDAMPFRLIFASFFFFRFRLHARPPIFISSPSLSLLVVLRLLSVFAALSRRFCHAFACLRDADAFRLDAAVTLCCLTPRRHYALITPPFTFSRRSYDYVTDCLILIVWVTLLCYWYLITIFLGFHLWFSSRLNIDYEIASPFAYRAASHIFSLLLIFGLSFTLLQSLLNMIFLLICLVISSYSLLFII